MAGSRYAGNEIIDGHHYGTWIDPTRKDAFAPDILDGVQCVEHSLSLGERLDTLAARYYGDEEYWWVIAMANRIQDPFGIQPGRRLKIPVDVRSILDKVR